MNSIRLADIPLVEDDNNNNNDDDTRSLCVIVRLASTVGQSVYPIQHVISWDAHVYLLYVYVRIRTVIQFGGGLWGDKNSRHHS